MLKTIPRFVWPVVLALAALKLVLLIHLNPGLEWNYDERRNGRIADNYLAGRGYVSFDAKRQQLRPDSFHASFPVFVYVAWQNAGLPKHRFTLLVFALTVGTYLLGALYVQRTLAYYGVGPPLAWAGAGLWAVYPSVVYYVGAYFWYENLALPLLIVVVYKLLRLSGGRPLRLIDALLIVGAVPLSCLLRGYLLAVYGLLFAAWLLLSRRAEPRVRRAAWRLGLLTLGVVVLAHLPILQKNHQLFGAYTLSNQAGFELLQGHNSTTEGRFMYDWDEPKGSFDQFVRANIPGLDSLNQYQESQARARLAWRWVRTHPGAELQLWLRKTALFFSPENFISDGPPTGYHPITAVVHLTFLLAIVLTLMRYRGLRFQRRDLLLLLPLVVVWLLSLVFFVGFRWRYFAEPAMLMFPLIMWQRLRRSEWVSN
ncbi:DUF3488 domain-containing protein [Hymenobacter cavernae]|uniref:Glycosyltransferase RgtA/B/C/D-like domain-containing protein n=1 Tax=Hymenobacter cavernae TaxID=2044852 RepID=A0ABQ1TVL3_9BACT|nr:DUF3488 domain-containing protein [Hymenobacter cavernae]GGF02205.1 hypothetical protein GCM10011383_11380 [Hymenobacter cavernae]